MSKLYKVQDLETKEIYLFTLEDILEEINRDHSEDFESYTEENWKQGWEDWVEGYGYWTRQNIGENE